MAKYDIRQLQHRLTDILVAFDNVCKEHGLTYYMMYGTMLGAVRHQGFIPWDDDIDLGMPRDDYEKLIQHAKEWLPEWMEFVCAENDKEYPVAFGKIQDARTTLIERAHYKYLGGIYCDIMPIDGIPANPLRQWLHIRHYHFWFRTLYLVHRDPYRHGHGVSSWLPRIVQKLFTLEGVQKKIRNVLTKYHYNDYDQICLYNDHTHAVISKKVFEPATQIPFEGHMFNGVHDTDAYLKHCFGNTYMQLPPVEKRHVHNFHYLDFDNPYKDYPSTRS